MVSRRTVERETRRKYILDITRKLVDEKDIQDVSMDDIARASEYTRRTLYAYFKSRDEILLSIFTDDLIARWSEQKLAVADADTGLAKLLTWAESLHAYTLRHPHSIRLQVHWDSRGIDRELISDEEFDRFEVINNELADGLREIFKLGVRDGTLRNDLPIDMTISQFLYSFRAILNRAFSSSYSFASFDRDEYVGFYLDLFFRGIRSKGDSQNEIK